MRASRLRSGSGAPTRPAGPAITLGYDQANRLTSYGTTLPGGVLAIGFDHRQPVVKKRAGQGAPIDDGMAASDTSLGCRQLLGHRSTGLAIYGLPTLPAEVVLEDRHSHPPAVRRAPVDAALAPHRRIDHLTPVPTGRDAPG
jgi:hypothetical protein